MESVLSAKLLKRKFALCRMLISFTVKKLIRQQKLKVENGKEPSWMPNQCFAALTNMRSVGVMGDFRTYDYAVAPEQRKTIDFMTAESAEIPCGEVLEQVMNRVINEVKGVNRVFYDQ